MTHVEILEQAMNVIKADLEVNAEYMEEERIKSLQHLERQMWYWYVEEKRQLYCKTIKEFLRHLEDSFPGDEEDETWCKFYETDFVITFGDKSVTVYNSADTYSAIECLLRDELDEYKES